MSSFPCLERTLTGSGQARAARYANRFLGVMLLAISAGCAAASPPAEAPSATASIALPVAPVPNSTVRNFPSGVFYLQAGPRSGQQWWSVWTISRDRETAVTTGELGRRISGFAASGRGMIVTANTGIAAFVARWTRTGPSWFHPAGKPHQIINAVAPAISPDGTLAYLNGKTGVWTRSSWTARDHLAYRVPENDGLVQAAFGPHRMLAMIGPYWQRTGTRPDVVILAHDGRGPVDLKLRSGFAELGYTAFWGTGAPALVIGSSHRTFELLYLSGRRQPLPAGWRPLTWNPAGTELLMVSRTKLGIWSPDRPHQVRAIGPISRGYTIPGAAWLSAPAARL